MSHHDNWEHLQTEIFYADCVAKPEGVLQLTICKSFIIFCIFGSDVCACNANIKLVNMVCRFDFLYLDVTENLIVCYYFTELLLK